MHRTLERLTIVFFLVLGSQALSRAGDAVVWFPGRTPFPPLFVHPDEPRFSFYQEIGSTLLRIGLGSSMDIVRFGTVGGEWRFGGQAYAYALSKDVEDVKFKIDAVDGFFGLSASWSGDSPWSFRFRALHMSAHLVDGNFDFTSNTWRSDNIPVPFSRNYGEALAAYSWSGGSISMRAYTGVTVSVFTRPRVIGPLTSFHGFEAAYPSSVSPYAAAGIHIMGVPRATATLNVEVGAMMGTWGGRGFRLGLGYASGLNPFGQYFDRKITRWTGNAVFEP